MPIYSAEQIAAVARSAGFQGESLVIAVAVALGESSGRTDVINSIGATGLWQILQPVHVRRYPHWTKAWLQNPRNNAEAAYILSNGGQNWRPWVVYTAGTYRMFMSKARAAVGNAGAAPPVVPSPTETAAPITTNEYSGLLGFARALSDKTVWLRTSMIFAGAILLVVAFFKLTGDNTISSTTKRIVKAAATKKVAL